MDYLDFSLDANKDYYSIQTSDTRESSSSTNSILFDHVRYQATLGHTRVAEPQQVSTEEDEEETHSNSASSSIQDSDDVFIQKPEFQEQLDNRRMVKNFMTLASSIPKANHFADSSMFLAPIGCLRNGSASSQTSTDILLAPDHLRSDTMESDVSSSSGECLLSTRGTNMSVVNSNSGYESSTHDFHEVMIEDTRL